MVWIQSGSRGRIHVAFICCSASNLSRVGASAGFDPDSTRAMRKSHCASASSCQNRPMHSKASGPPPPPFRIEWTTPSLSANEIQHALCKNLKMCPRSIGHQVALEIQFDSRPDPRASSKHAQGLWRRVQNLQPLTDKMEATQRDWAQPHLTTRRTADVTPHLPSSLKSAVSPDIKGTTEPLAGDAAKLCFGALANGTVQKRV